MECSAVVKINMSVCNRKIASIQYSFLKSNNLSLESTLVSSILEIFKQDDVYLLLQQSFMSPYRKDSN